MKWRWNETGKKMLNSKATKNYKPGSNAAGLLQTFSDDYALAEMAA